MNDTLNDMGVDEATPPVGGPGAFDLQTIEQYTSPWHDQKAMMCLSFPLTLTGGGVEVSQVFEVKEIPLWWVLCTQASAQAVAILGGPVVTARQSVGDRVSFHASYSLYYDVVNTANIFYYGPPRRLIVKAHTRFLTVAAVDPVGNSWYVDGTVFAVGAGIDPSKVGLF